MFNHKNDEPSTQTVNETIVHAALLRVVAEAMRQGVPMGSDMLERFADDLETLGEEFLDRP